jgi:hypothetical protein
MMEFLIDNMFVTLGGRVFQQTISMPMGTHCPFRGVGMKHIYLFLWYPLFQSQWDRCDQRNHQTYNYLVK